MTGAPPSGSSSMRTDPLSSSGSRPREGTLSSGSRAAELLISSALLRGGSGAWKGDGPGACRASGGMEGGGSGARETEGAAGDMGTLLWGRANPGKRLPPPAALGDRARAPRAPSRCCGRGQDRGLCANQAEARGSSPDHSGRSPRDPVGVPSSCRRSPKPRAIIPPSQSGCRSWPRGQRPAPIGTVSTPGAGRSTARWTETAPAPSNAWAHASRVAPLVQTSSIRRTAQPRTCSGSRAAKAPFTFATRASRRRLA